ncbi:unnamed protein product [Moneuplotes crassus]|uniref:Mur ligase central domain-containing protein n=1 Tax=Euplotes crassus TaxID=5936 RepID=A0AAD1UI75_EUPCR|nr:unnamed protein product [Moneuplotes crassus]
MESFKKFSLFTLPKYCRTSLQPVKEFHELIGRPGLKYKTIHVTGTNGKGTVCNKIAKILSQAGFRTGLFTSPHLVKFNERICISGEQISDEDLFEIEHDLMEKYHALPEPQLVVFDMITMIALKYFEIQKVDFAVLEVGIGGDLDSTNIVKPECSVITSIGLDHRDILGNTKEEISQAKCGIFKENTPIVIGSDCPQEHMVNFLKENLEADDSLIHLIDSKPNSIEEENQEIARRVVNILKDRDFQISDSAIKQGLLEKVPGRFQQFSKNIFYDGAHNPDGIRKSISSVFNLLPKDFDRNVTVVCGFTREANLDENISAVLENENIDKIDTIYFCENSPGEPEMINFQPSCIKLDKIESLLGDMVHEKLKVLSKSAEGEFESIELHSLTDKTTLISHLEDVLTYLQNDPKFQENYIFVFGTFRLYKDLYEYSQMNQ